MDLKDPPPLLINNLHPGDDLLRVEFYTAVREWIILLIVFLILYSAAFSYLDWLFLKHRRHRLASSTSSTTPTVAAARIRHRRYGTTLASVSAPSADRDRPDHTLLSSSNARWRPYTFHSGHRLRRVSRTDLAALAAAGAVSAANTFPTTPSLPSSTTATRTTSSSLLLSSLSSTTTIRSFLFSSARTRPDSTGGPFSAHAIANSRRRGQKLSNNNNIITNSLNNNYAFSNQFRYSTDDLHYTHKALDDDDVDEEEENEEEEEEEEEEEYLPQGVDSLVPLMISAAGLAVAKGSVLLLPTTLIVNALLGSFDMDALYLGWLDHSLLQNSAVNLSLMTDLVLYGLVPFAFFYQEQEYMKRGWWNKVRESFLAVCLVDTIYLIGLWVAKDLILGWKEMDLWAVLLVCRHILGWVVFLWAVPAGMRQLFEVTASLPVRVGTRIQAKARLSQLELEIAAWEAKLDRTRRMMALSLASKKEEPTKLLLDDDQSIEDLGLPSSAARLNAPSQRPRLRLAPGSDSQAKEAANKARLIEIQQRLQRLVYEKQKTAQELFVSPWKRSALFFGCMTATVYLYFTMLTLLGKRLVFGPLDRTPTTTYTTQGPTITTTEIALVPTLEDALWDSLTVMSFVGLALCGLFRNSSWISSMIPAPLRTRTLTMVATIPVILIMASSSWSMVECLGLVRSANQISPTLYHYFLPPLPQHTVPTPSSSGPLPAAGTGSANVSLPSSSPHHHTPVEAVAKAAAVVAASLGMAGDYSIFDHVLGATRRSWLESLVRWIMFILMSLLSAQWIVHRLIRLQGRKR